MEVKRWDSLKLERKLRTLRVIGFALFVLLLILTVVSYLNEDGSWGPIQAFTNVLIPFLGLAMSFSGHHRLQKVQGSYIQFEDYRLRFRIEQSEHSLAVPEDIVKVEQLNKEVEIEDASGKRYQIPYDIFGGRTTREKLERAFAKIEAKRKAAES